MPRPRPATDARLGSRVADLDRSLVEHRLGKNSGTAKRPPSPITAPGRTNRDGRTRDAMKQIFHPQDRAILFDYFGMERPEELRAVDVLARGGTSDDPKEPVLVEPDADRQSSTNGAANAVARLLLARIQSRLPQWMTRKEGKLVSARQHRKAKSRQVDPLPQFLFEINWANSGPGFSWPEAYHVTYVPGFQRFVVTASQDSPDAYGYADLAIGWFAEGADVIQGSKRVILEWWEQSRRTDHEGWEHFLSSGLVGEDEAQQWKDEIWSDEAEEEEEDGSPIEYSSRGIPIRFVTVVVRKSAIESGYPGGFARFLESHPRPLLEDEKLVGIVSMSMGEAEGTFVALKEAGVNMDGAGALADMVRGPLRAARGIAFRRERSEDPLAPGWHALALDEGATRTVARRAMLESFGGAIAWMCEEVCAGFPRPTSYPAGIAHGMRRARIRSFLEDYVAEHGRLPEGEHEVPGAGKLRF